ncbi:MAG TPA: phosphoribosylformylglycinamidine synthase subunit PurL [Planctomycetota bacterium]|nr:phosphoribosylformylglycinamidine synthase subunit PurL [Planctomycetota bacterium]
MPKAWTVEVFHRDGFGDPEGNGALAAARESGLSGVDSVRSIRGYLLPAALSSTQVERAAAELLADPVGDRFVVLAPGVAPTTEGVRITVRRHPGVLDPVAGSVRRALALLDLEVERAATFRAYEFLGDAKPASVLAAVRRSLANETIETATAGAEPSDLPEDPLPRPFEKRRVPLGGLDEEGLLRISREGMLALSSTEMRAIRDHFEGLGRDPSDLELETIAQTWSEHCKHKTFTGRIELEEDGRRETIVGLFDATIRKATETIAAPWCLSVFRDNAGIVTLDDRHALAFKAETHNHPSALEPYGGAGTGLGGVVRDVLGAGLGARPIASTDVFCVGPPDSPEEGLPEGVLHPRRILRGVVAGVRDYGNCLGVPTVNGAVLFDPGFTATPLVFCGNLGILPLDRVAKGAREGDLVLLAGGRTGRDGIHGATFSSDALHAALPGSVVQIGDPLTEKKLIEAVVRARDEGLFRSITDCGAGGLSSAVGEMAEGLGAEVDLERVPLKYPGLTPAEIWVSEAQERMVLAVSPDRAEAILRIFGGEELEATVIGRFSGTGRLLVRYRGETWGDLDLGFLHEGCPRPTKRAKWTSPGGADPDLPPREDYGEDLRALLAHPDAASKEWIVRQYDHEVQAGSAGKPLVGPNGEGPSDAAVVVPVPGERRGVALGCGIRPRYGRIDPYAMAASAIDEALRNVVAVGGDPTRTALLDNFAAGSPERPETLGELVRAAKACRDVAIAYGTPFISGKDSLHNEFRAGGATLVAPTTLLVTAVSRVEDVGRCVTSDLKGPGNHVYLVGRTRPEIGGSLLLEIRGAGPGRSVPRLEPREGLAALRALARVIAEGTALSVHDLSEGGLALAAAEMAIGGGVGLDLDLRSVPVEAPLREDILLFSESNSRFLVEVPRGSQEAFEGGLGEVPYGLLGETTGAARLLVRGLEGQVVLDEPVARLREAWKGTLAW